MSLLRKAVTYEGGFLTARETEEDSEVTEADTAEGRRPSS